jgi:hypothetical protein
MKRLEYVFTSGSTGCGSSVIFPSRKSLENSISYGTYGGKKIRTFNHPIYTHKSKTHHIIVQEQL